MVKGIFRGGGGETTPPPVINFYCNIWTGEFILVNDLNLLL